MRVTFSNIEEFTSELVREATRLWRKEVRYRIDLTPEQREAISFSVAIQFTALVDADEGQFIMEISLRCGSDDPAEGDGHEGTNSAEKIKRIVAERMADFGVELHPGKIEV